MSSLPSQTAATETFTECGRTFSADEVQLIKDIIVKYPKLSRQELAATVCELLEWERPNGRLKTRECRDLLEKLAQREALALPDKSAGRPVGSKTQIAPPESETPSAVTGPLAELRPIRLVRTNTTELRKQWRSYVEHYHYLGCRVPFGAHLRYLIQGGKASQTLGALQFSSPAWRMRPRDQWIGWDEPTRKSNLQYIVNQSRFLILPWVEVKNLASHILALSAKQIVTDWYECYHVRPLMLESLVDEQRYSGTCYRAANWINVGRTTGRGRMDRTHQRHGAEPKQIFLYPLESQARAKLNASQSG